MAAPLFWQPVEAQTVLDRISAPKLPEPPGIGLESGPELDVQNARAESGKRFPDATIRVGSIILKGLTRLHNSDFSDIIERYMGRSLNPDELRELTGAITNRFQQKGFVFAQATALPQNMTAGLLRIDVDEGKIDEIRLTGFANSAVQRSLRPLIGNGPPPISEIEHRLLIAGDLTGMTLRQPRYLREDGRGVLIIDVIQKRVAIIAGIDNSGSRPVGPIQADLTVVLSQVLAADDAVTFSVLVTPADPSELAYGRIQYAKRISSDGTQVSVATAYSSSRPGSFFRLSDVRGTSFQVDAIAVKPLVRSKDASLWARAGLSYTAISQEAENVSLRRDDIVSEIIGLYGVAQLAGGTLRSSLTISHLDLTEEVPGGAAGGIFPANSITALLAADWTTPTFKGLSGHFAVATQLSNHALPPGAQFALGGTASVRGYNYGERLADNGSTLSLEARLDLPNVGMLKHSQLYSFADGGQVVNAGGGFAGGALLSSGGGIRTVVGNATSADLALAVPLSGPRYDSLGQTPVVKFRLAKGF